MLRKWQTISLVILLIGSISLSLAPATPSKGADPTGTLADILAAGKIQVGSDVAYPPFEDIDLGTGDVVGFDVDIMEELAAYISAEYDTNITVEFVASDWDPIIPNLVAEQFDVIMSAMTITTAREELVDFTRWYYQSAMGILVTTANPENILNTDDLNDAGVTIGVQTGTTTHIWLQDEGIDDVATVLTYDDFPLAIVALKAGNVDCVLGDVAVLNLDAVESGLTKVVYAWEGDEPERFGIACRTGDDDLRLALNAAIENILGDDEENPIITRIYNEIYEEWHGTDHAGYIQPTETLAAIIATGKIRVGSDVAYPPFEDIDLGTGDVVGFDVDVMDELAAYMSIKYSTTITAEFVASDWDPIIPNLQAQQFDVIMSAMTITTAREELVDFTRWYYQSAMGILVATANPKAIMNTDDLNDAGVTIGVQTGTTTHIWLQDEGIDDVATVLTYDDFPLAIVALKAGNVDCVLGDVAVLNLDAVESGLTKVVYAWEGDEPERFGIACRTGDDALRLALNDGLDSLLGDNEATPVISKTYNDIYKEWHGTDHSGYVPPVTTTTEPTTSEAASSEDPGLIPGFEAIFAIFILIGSSLWLRSRK